MRAPNYKLPAVCDVLVTNVCNAACDFCGFARDKTLVGAARYLDADAFARALPILRRRGIRFMTLQGGEPLVHPDIVRLVSETTAAGISCAIITNGWFLPRYIDQLAAAGLDRLIISIDSANLAEHELNRGLEGLERRIAEGIAGARTNGLPVQASVTVNRLVRWLYSLPPWPLWLVRWCRSGVRVLQKWSLGAGDVRSISEPALRGLPSYCYLS